jgi:hypothetical protein
LQLYGQQTGPGAEAEAKAATYSTFDIKGSTIIAPLCINPAGAITGYYRDANGLVHGFLRIPAHQDDDTEDNNTKRDSTEGGSD